MKEKGQESNSIYMKNFLIFAGSGVITFNFSILFFLLNVNISTLVIIEESA